MNLSGKRVLLRADANVPLDNGTIRDDYRLQALRPTLDFILNNNGKIILITHIGRPTNQEPELSTKHLVPWFEHHGYSVDFAHDIETAHKKSLEKNNSIVMVENIRFFPGEQNSNAVFAQQLAQCGDFYVNDAFGLLHRTDTSITQVPKLFAQENKTIGFLIKKELAMVSKLINNPKKPFVLVLGGGKLKDKITLLQTLLPHLSTVLLCPAIVFTFLKSLGKNVGASLVDETMLSTCKNILDNAQKHNVTVLFPKDYLITHDNLENPLQEVLAENFPDNGIGVSIGATTQKLFSSQLQQAKIIIFSGLMGFTSRKKTLNAYSTLLKTAEQSAAFSVIGGGDSVAAARMLGFNDQQLTFSTGGGAFLATLTQQSLPGLANLASAKK